MDVQFLQQATEQVISCRQVLKYTYVFGYYLPDGKEKTLFEHLQEQLERSTETLSEMSELPLAKVLEKRAEIVNYQRFTGKFMQGLLEGVESGLTGHDGTA